jgi:hypothetical protein
MFTTRTAVVVACGECGHNATNDDGQELWFPDESAATAYLKDDKDTDDTDYVAAWAVRPDGTLICGPCVRKARCERDGHRWMPRLRGHYCRTDEPGHEVGERGFCTRLMRMCRCCWEFELVAVAEMSGQGVA